MYATDEAALLNSRRSKTHCALPSAPRRNKADAITVSASQMGDLTASVQRLVQSMDDYRKDM
jgi:hypothetical protein